MTDHFDLSPSLGGTRAGPAEPEAPAGEAPRGEPAAGPEAEARPEFEALFGPEGAEVLEAIAQFGAVSGNLSSLVTETIQSLEAQLPAAMSAVEGLFGALEQAFEQAFDSLGRDDETGSGSVQ